MKSTSILTIFALATTAILPISVLAQVPTATEYAEEQCGNGGYQALGYPSYQDCFDFAVDFYYWHLEAGGGGSDGGGGSGGGSGGGKSGTWIPGIPGYGGEPGCPSRIKCNETE